LVIKNPRKGEWNTTVPCLQVFLFLEPPIGYHNGTFYATLFYNRWQQGAGAIKITMRLCGPALLRIRRKNVQKPELCVDYKEDKP
jgi:hypothetical protein